MLINFAIIDNWSNDRYEMIVPESGADCMSSACSIQVSAESLTQQRSSEFVSSWNLETVDSIALH
jgi:hypothetical protein